MIKFTIGHIFGISCVCVSGLAGFLVFLLLKKGNGLSSITKLILIKNPNSYKYLGVGIFKQLIVKTPLRLGNPKIKINRFNIKELKRVRNEIIKSEISHFFGFIISQLIALVYLMFLNNVSVFITISVLNVPMNMYPVLLQQMNRLRITELIEKRERVYQPVND